ncbi:MAG: hypothetical protein ACTHNB_01700 [Gaiellaceae bacterium]
MSRAGLGIVSLVVSLVLAGVLFSSQLGAGGSKASSPDKSPLIQQAQAAAATADAMQAERLLAAYQAENGTFVGATVTGVQGVTLVHAEPTTFCLQVTTGESVLYDAGPGGTLSARPC